MTSTQARDELAQLTTTQSLKGSDRYTERQTERERERDTHLGKG